MKRAILTFFAAFCGSVALAQTVDGTRKPLQLIEDVCVRASLSVNEARRGVDLTERLATLKAEDPSVHAEILKRLEATEIERGMRQPAGDPWDANREAAACLERNRHVALAYLTAE